MRARCQDRADRGRRRGSVASKVLFVICLLGLGAVAAGEGIDWLRHRWGRRAWEAQLQEFSAAASAFRAEHGRWPLNPEEMGSHAAASWRTGSPFGGEYEWHAAAPGEPAEIRLTDFHPHPPLTCTRSDLAAIDRDLDDGNPATGRFRTGFNGWPVLRLEEKH